jgi:hypothetical protein
MPILEIVWIVDADLSRYFIVWMTCLLLAGDNCSLLVVSYRLSAGC